MYFSGCQVASHSCLIQQRPTKAIKYLEPSFSNAANIYEEVSKKNMVKLPVTVLEKIFHLCSVRSKDSTIHDLNAGIALIKLNEHIVAYAKGAWPFNHVFMDKAKVVKYWCDLLNHDSADVLVCQQQIGWILHYAAP
ncbi:hypothetical protein DFJ58DRAFT_845902 [Suillus subalutaceus]|uniref:uncharacterized protein n=1 Tax=Suillus subalutaceus TaxID=48586 RepID=UPI001B85E1E9|nr:uncharacterized protein DFJ58DRAFT_845902 [Suillus subalutaceus]KAG1838860.1 hypothetical protein DFJ58DRAFT_845902 [Suillus subalutaceus]